MANDSDQFASPMSIPSVLSSGIAIGTAYMIFRSAYILGQDGVDRGTPEYMRALSTMCLAMCAASLIVVFVKFVN